MPARRLGLLIAALGGALLTSGPGGAFEAPDLGLSLPDPPGWEIRPGPPEGAVVRWCAPPAPGPRATLDLRFHELATGERLSPALVGSLLGALRAGLDSFQLLGSRPAPAGAPWDHRVGYRASLGGRRFQVTQGLVVREGRLWVLSLTSSPEAHPARLPVFEELLGHLGRRASHPPAPPSPSVAPRPGGGGGPEA